jgi:hypothetical protein
MAEPDEKIKYGYTVHTIGGEKITIEAEEISIKPEDNRVYFLGVDETEYGEWVFFLNGVAAIHKHPPDKPVPESEGVWSFSRQDY